MDFLSLGWLLFLGIAVGIAVALPYGPVGFVTIRRFYLFGMKSGMYSALGTALSDMFYASVIGFSLQRISQFLLSIASLAEIVAGAALIYLGIRSIRDTMVLAHGEEENHPVQDVVSTFFINALNPTLIFSFALVFTILAKIVGGTHGGTYGGVNGGAIGFSGTAVFILGIMIGTLGLWYVIGRFIRYLRHKNRDDMVKKINYAVGIVLLLAGLVVSGMAVAHLVVK